MKLSFKKILFGFSTIFFLGDLSAMYSVETDGNNQIKISHDGDTTLVTENYSDGLVSFSSDGKGNISITNSEENPEIKLDQLFLKGDTVSFVSNAHIGELLGNFNCLNVYADIIIDKCPKLPGMIMIDSGTKLTIGETGDTNGTTIVSNGTLNLWGENLTASQLKDFGFNVISETGVSDSNVFRIENYVEDSQQNLFAKLTALGDGNCGFISVFIGAALHKILTDSSADHLLQVLHDNLSRQQGVQTVLDALSSNDENLKKSIIGALSPETRTFCSKQNVTESDVKDYLNYMQQSDAWIVASNAGVNSLLDALTFSLGYNCLVITGLGIPGYQEGRTLHHGVFNENWPTLYFQLNGQHFSPLIFMEDVEKLRTKGIQFGGDIQ